MTEELSVYPSGALVIPRASTIDPMTQGVLDNLPKIRFIGCGGTGINNTVRVYKDFMKLKTKINISWTVIDTSYSNAPLIGGLNIDKHFISDKQGEIKGRGKLRTTEDEFGDFEKKLTGITKTMLEDDIYILTASTTGGSGSMILPVLVRELLSQGKVVIVLAVIESSLKASSRMEVLSSMKVLHNFDLLCDHMYEQMYEDGESVTPIINIALFDNSIGGQEQVDNELRAYALTLFQVMDIADIPTMDKANLINTFNPARIPELRGFYGLKQMVLGVIDDDEAPIEYKTTRTPEQIDTCLVKVELNCSTDTVAQVRFIGSKDTLAGGVYCLTGLAIPEDIYAKIEEAENIASKIKNTQTTFSSSRVDKVKKRGNIIL
jgi:hypothetical protein